MLLWDHSVRRLMHTSPPWDVPQASPSAINQAFRSRDATLNPKLHLVPITSPFSSPKSSHFAHFFFLDLYVPSFTLISQLGSIQLNPMQMIQLSPRTSDHRFRYFKLVTNASNSSQFEFKSPQMTQIVLQLSNHHSKLFKLSRTRPNVSNSTQFQHNSPRFKSNASQLASGCQHMSLNHHELPKMRRTHSRSAH